MQTGVRTALAHSLLYGDAETQLMRSSGHQTRCTQQRLPASTCREEWRERERESESERAGGETFLPITLPKEKKSERESSHVSHRQTRHGLRPGALLRRG